MTSGIRIWEKVGTEEILADKFGIKVGVQNYRNPKSGEVEEHSFFVKKNGVTIMPITLEGNLLIVRQYKQAAHGVVTEFPAGVEQKNEDAAVRARIELLEETGYRAERFVHLNKLPVLMAPRKSPSYCHLFAALGCQKMQEQTLDAGEADLLYEEVAPAQFRGLIESGEIRASETLMAAFLAQLHGLVSF